MKKNLSKFSIVSLLVLSLAIFITGCESSKSNPEDKREGLNVEQENDLPGDRNINENTVKDPNSDNIGNDDLDRNELNDGDVIDNDGDNMTNRSEVISEKLTEIEGIKNATVIITGNTALIGVDIPADTQDDKIKELKNKVESTTKNTDKDIDHVAITADADIVTRIANMGKEIANGKPISGFAKEIEETVKRITPNM